ncbi:MAG: amino acid permease [Candidatus Odinarchaeum yellowstonii]|uniref:Amino acid permease n=1 Tax=Odinarchaeota yellowstonii (strain LCB_4) TaxID=1841599 RepID=A0AAF0IBD3_ODILC|nr:MAG: amino acid permease [Candidatus Odinarchaeum yellowstonii]
MVEGGGELKRRVSLVGLTFYGVGNILGAGIYALIGPVVGLAGNMAWLPFLLTAFIGLLTGLSYAELSSMYPKSAASFVYVDRAFRIRVLSFILGWVVIFSGLFSAATVALGFGDYLSVLLGLSGLEASMILAAVLIVVMSLVNYIGIRESTWMNVVFTLIEASGLLLIIFIGVPFLGSVNYFELPAGGGLLNILSTVNLVFFAYLGFEVIANLSEEGVDAKRSVPKAIIFSILITTVIYCLVAVSVVSILPYDLIASSPAPLKTVVLSVLGPVGGFLMSFIALFATANTVLIVLVTTSRLVYGMAKDKALPAPLCRVSKRTGTPTIAVLFVMAISLLMLLLGDISLVANATVFGILIVFLFVNLSVIILRRRYPEADRPFKISLSFKWIPVTAVTGAVICLLLLFSFEPLIILIQFIIVVAGLLLFIGLGKRISRVSCE